MARENLSRRKAYARELAANSRVDEQELSALQQRAMRTAEAFGCEAGVEVMDFVDSDPPGSRRLKIVVVRRTRSGELLCRESNVVLMTDQYAASVGQLVSDAAAKLAEQ